MSSDHRRALDRELGVLERLREALRRDWEQTKHDFWSDAGRELNQDLGDTVAQAAGVTPIPPRNTPVPCDFRYP